MSDLTNDEIYDAIAFLIHQPGRSCELGRFMSRFHVVWPSSRIFSSGYVAADPSRSPCLVTITEKGFLFYSSEKQRRESRAGQRAQQEAAQQLQQELARRQNASSWWRDLLQLLARFLGFCLGLFLILRR